MTAHEVRLARDLAHTGEDLSLYDDSVLFGCACEDFKHPVEVSLGVVAKLMRWQYLCFDGTWDERLWNEERWVYQRRIRLADPKPDELLRWYGDKVARVIEQAP